MSSVNHNWAQARRKTAPGFRSLATRSASALTCHPGVPRSAPAFAGRTRTISPETKHRAATGGLRHDVSRNHGRPAHAMVVAGLATGTFGERDVQGSYGGPAAGRAVRPGSRPAGTARGLGEILRDAGGALWDGAKPCSSTGHGADVRAYKVTPSSPTAGPGRTPGWSRSRPRKSRCLGRPRPSRRSPARDRA